MEKWGENHPLSKVLLRIIQYEDTGELEETIEKKEKQIVRNMDSKYWSLTKAPAEYFGDIPPNRPLKYRKIAIFGEIYRKNWEMYSDPPNPKSRGRPCISS